MLGIDVSAHQSSLDWQKAKAAGVRFAWLKSSEGIGFRDSSYIRHRREAAEVGIRTGAYHFARPDTGGGNADAIAEANFFLDVAKPQKGDILPALDFEHEPPNSEWALTFLRHVESKIGERPIFYSFPAFIARMSQHGELDRFPLWLASFGPNDGKRHPVNPPSGFHMVAHQFTSNGHLEGISTRLDLNHAEKLDPLILGISRNIWVVSFVNSKGNRVEMKTLHPARFAVRHRKAFRRGDVHFDLRKSSV